MTILYMSKSSINACGELSVSAYDRSWHVDSCPGQILFLYRARFSASCDGCHVK